MGCVWLRGQAWPDATSPRDRSPGLVHASSWSGHVTVWVTLRRVCSQGRGRLL